MHLKKILNPKKQMIVFDECEDSLCYDSLKEKLKINKILDEENGICVFYQILKTWMRRI